MSEELVPITLVPVEVFGGDCACHEKHGEGQRADCIGWGYGLSDAVRAWSDCNRADNRIYRVDDTDPKHRGPGETMIVYVPRGSVAWFEKHWGEGAQQRAEVEAAQEQVVAAALGRPPVDTVSVRVGHPSVQGETFHIARCRDCGPGDLPIPFTYEAERNSWVERHVTRTGHAVEATVEHRTVAP